jgi:hypothetical protein
VRVKPGVGRAPAIAGVLLFGCFVIYAMVRPKVTAASEP